MVSNVGAREEEVEIQIHVGASRAVRGCRSWDQRAHGVIDMRDRSSLGEKYPRFLHVICGDLDSDYSVISSRGRVDVFGRSVGQIKLKNEAI